MSLQQPAQTGRSPPLIPNSPMSFYFLDTPWLGSKHDGHPQSSSTLGYFERCGAQDLSSKPDLQSFLIFGVLETVLLTKVPESKLICIRQGRWFLIDEHIGEILREWRARLQQRDDADVAERRESVLEVLEMASSLALLINPTDGEFDGDVTLQIACLYEAVYLSVIPLPDLYNYNPHIPGLDFPSPSLGFIIPDSRMHDLKQRGWCPYLIHILSPSPSVISYIATQSPFTRNSIHEHAGCTHEGCTINDLEEHTRRARHTSPGCACDWVKPSLVNVAEALSDGHTPVVQLTQDDRLITKLSSEASYVAIAHELADGLGSTTEEGLPLCQVKKLAEWARTLVPGGTFWMDSLCVPAVHEGRRKNAAMPGGYYHYEPGMTAEIYSNAAVVLVLDEGIRSIPSKSSSAQKLLRVLGSGWIQRLSVLEAEMMPQKLMFEFSDGLVSEADVLPDWAEDYHHPVTFNLVKQLFRLTKYRARQSSAQRIPAPLAPRPTPHTQQSISAEYTLPHSESPMSSPLFWFTDTQWLGGKHDGYPIASSLCQYWSIRWGRLGEWSDVSFEHSPRGNPTPDGGPIQTLLTFGVLEAVLRTRVPESKFLRTKQGQTVFVDEHLGDVLGDWRMRVQQLSPDSEARKEWMISVGIILHEACMIYGLAVMHWLHDDHSAGSAAASFIWHIICLLGAVRHSWLGFNELPFRDVFIDTWRPLLSGKSFIPQTLIEGTIQRGWCPFLLERLKAHSLNGAVIGYVNSQRPWIRDSTQEHQNCTTSGCTLNNLDTSTYRTKHIRSDCNCDWVRLELDDVADALSKDTIPVVYLTEDNRLIAKSSSDAPYAAISHVWSDGLGSTTEEGLPLCQLKKLATMTSALVDGGAFWIDSLCVPEAREYRKKAIGLMARVYREAAVVLVLDAGIRSLSSKSPLTQKILRIVASGWMQRLWTLQEAMLAKELVFEFSDGRESTMLLELDMVSSGMDHHPVTIQLMAQLSRVLPQYNPIRTFHKISWAMKHRNTSHPEDETLAIAGLLDVDAYALASLPPDERIPGLFLRVGKLPSIIAFSGGKKLDRLGFRWAPISLMSEGVATSESGDLDAICTPEGLLATYYIVPLPPMVACQREWNVLDGRGDRYYKVKIDGEGPVEGATGWALDLLLLPSDSGFLGHGIAGMTYNASHLASKDARVVCKYQTRVVFLAIAYEGGAAHGVEIIQAAGPCGMDKVLLV